MAIDTDKVHIGLLQPGVIIGDSYRVEVLLGRGGMGEVWAARHLRLPDRRTAVKVLRTHGGAPSEEALVRFRREAEIVSRLKHPHIVDIVDYASTPSGYPFMVMEFLEGESLGARLKRSPLSLAEARTVLRQTCSALEMIHSQGIVHRDLKPDNIFLTMQGTELWVKVLDFGISRILGANTQLTEHSVVIGSPRYMSPEQVQFKELTFQSDIFSLGAVAYEMLTGKHAFEGDEVERVLSRVVHAAPKPLKKCLPELPAGAQQAIEKALEKHPEKRHVSATAFCAAFEKDEPRRPWLLMFLVGMLALSIVGGAFAYRQYVHSPLEDAPSKTDTNTPHSTGPGTPPATPDNRDSDGDGLVDKEDACPEESGPVSLQGCPDENGDSDGDGLIDKEDACPEEPGLAELKGCPDKDGDGDGIADRLDNCPEEPGPLQNRGCPVKSPKNNTSPKNTSSKNASPRGDAKTKKTPPPPVPPRPPPGPNAEEKRILAGAEKALQAKQYNDAEWLARRALSSLKEGSPGSIRAYIVMLEVACAQKDLAKYNAAYASVPAEWKPFAKANCKRLGFEI